MPFIASSNGTAATLAFMFAVRYGFFPDQSAPFGRLQPYLAVGPALLFSSQRPTTISPPFGVEAKQDDFPSKSSVNLALAVETGLRWMCLKNVSLDLSFKYRYAAPTYHYYVKDEYGFTHQAKIDTIYNLFSFQVGAAYHF